MQCPQSMVDKLALVTNDEVPSVDWLNNNNRKYLFVRSNA